MLRPILLLAALLLAACTPGVPDDARIVVAGDSVMAWNRLAGASVADALGQRLGEPVGDVSLPLARMNGGNGALSIPNQLRGVRAEWVVLNGGANDIRGACSCNACGPTIDRLISDDGRQGTIPALVGDLRRRGARVIWADYYTTAEVAGTTCERPYRVLEARLARMAEADAGVVLVDMDDVFTPGDPALFAGDGIHPTPLGSARIAGLAVPFLTR